MIILYHFGPAFGLPDPSPFCSKVHLYLRAAGLEFESRAGYQYLRNAPKGKLPYIDDDGTRVADSEFIISHLKAKYGDPLDGGLGAEQRAVAHAFTKMMDENLYWCMVYSRWLDPATWPTVRSTFFGGMPAPLRAFVPTMAQRRVRKTLYGQGLGRHKPEEILEITRRDLAALSAYLGTRDYFLGERMTTLDVTAWAFLAGLIIPDLDNGMTAVARSFENLTRFVERIRARYYPA